jgi:hypothetical protein
VQAEPAAVLLNTADRLADVNANSGRKWTEDEL